MIMPLKNIINPMKNYNKPGTMMMKLISKRKKTMSTMKNRQSTRSISPSKVQLHLRQNLNLRNRVSRAKRHLACHLTVPLLKLSSMMTPLLTSKDIPSFLTEIPSTSGSQANQSSLTGGRLHLLIQLPVGEQRTIPPPGEQSDSNA